MRSPPQPADRTEALRCELCRRFGLTPMEAIVTEHLLRGFNYECAARRLGISPHTIHAHVKAIHRKARVSTTLELSALLFELRFGLDDPAITRSGDTNRLQRR
jgi:DNA-binding CsgD family transcriptional regulator